MNALVKRGLSLVIATGVMLLLLSGCGPQEGSGASSEEIVHDVEPTVTSYPFMEGTVEENVITVIDSGVEGPTVFIAAGIHGDEIAAWMAGDRLEEELRITRGVVYILSPVNLSGSLAETRFVVDSGDMNRVFPGDADSDDMATRIAAALFNEINEIKPDFILDLHEAKVQLGGGSTGAGLANTIIYSDDSKISELLFDFTIANESGELLDRTFGLTTPGVTGSFNRVVTDQLGIPVITTETWRKLEVEHRIGQQIEIVNFCLNYYGMIELPEN